MSANKLTLSALLTTLGFRIAALQKYGAALGPSILIEGQAFTTAQLVAIYQACINDHAQVTSARGAVKVLVAQQTKDDAARVAVDQGLKAAVVAKFGSTSQAMTDFGFGKQPKKATTKVKAQAVLQTASTRKERHIMGKLQRSQIKPVPTAQPAAQPAAPVATGAPPPVKG